MVSLKPLLRLGLALLFCVLVLTLSFQNCAPQPVEQYDSASTGTDNSSGNSSIRLPPPAQEQVNSSLVCSVSVSNTNVAAGGIFVFNLSASAALPAGYKVVHFGTKNGVTELFGGTVTTGLSITYSNPGHLAGDYTRYFQIVDSSGRAVCETNAVAFTLQGRGCSLSVESPVVKVGQTLVYNITYAQANPAGATLWWAGTNSGNPIPGGVFAYAQTNINRWTYLVKDTDRGQVNIRSLVVQNPNTTVFCQTNEVQVRFE